MRLFIAEKPSVAKAIAGELGGASRGDGFFKKGNDVITWCFGHLLEQAEPDEYTSDTIPKTGKGKKVWRFEDLPIIPERWILHPKKDSKKQLAVIGKLLRDANNIVNAGDPDREGQLLVDEVLEHFKNTKPVQRFWVSAQDSVSIRRGLKSLKSNHEFLGWADAARARQRADWLIGMNLSRAYTLQAKKSGANALVTVGRVQTPTLALVVARDREIENFKSIPFYSIDAVIHHENGSFKAKWKPKEDQQGLDTDGRLVDLAIANEIKQKLKDQPGNLIDYKQIKKKAVHPTAYSLSDITVAASNKYGMTSDEVLKGCQSLYETHKLTSYPRTDCGFLPESQHADAPRVLKAISLVNADLIEMVDRCDPSFKSKTWNDKKVTAHHGIIPTMHHGDKSKLTDKEKKLYDLIVRAYLAQFYPYHEYLSTIVNVDVQGEVLATQGKVILVNGWKDIYQEHGSDEDNQKIPKMNKGDSVQCLEVTRNDLKTKPPAHFTDGTLTRAMENIHRFVTDPEHKKHLREGDGIGTSATRASILTELKRRRFLELKGKKILSTELGRSVVDSLPLAVTSPVLTALYERMLKGIESGEEQISNFMAKQEAFIRKQVVKAGESITKIAVTNSDKPRAAASEKYKCSSCGHGLIRRPSKRKGTFWWGCSHYPQCKQTYRDLKGQPKYQRQQVSAET